MALVGLRALPGGRRNNGSADNLEVAKAAFRQAWSGGRA